MIEPCLADTPDRAGIERLVQIEPADLRADMFGQRDDVEGGFGCDSHGTSSFLSVAFLKV